MATVDPAPLQLTHDAPVVLDCAGRTTREINTALRTLAAQGVHQIRLLHPAARHNLAVALLEEVDVTVEGPAGYFLGGMIDGPRLRVRGNCGWSVGETMLSGEIWVEGHAGNSAAASMRGGTVIIHGDAGARSGISMKGGLLLVGGSVGYMSGFMMQRGTIVICGDAGPAIGDSMYAGEIFVGGRVDQPGTDVVIVEPGADEQLWLGRTIQQYGLVASGPFKKLVSGHKLWNFSKKEIGVWIEAL